MSEVMNMEVVRQSHRLGYLRDAAHFFENEKRRIMNSIGDLYDVRVPLNRILVAIYSTPEERRTEKGFIIHTSDNAKEEEKWQGKSGLVVKMGPHCYEPNEGIEWHEDDKCQVGDWIMFRVGEGFKVEVWGYECIMLESERSIKAVLDRPDSVF